MIDQNMNVKSQVTSEIRREELIVMLTRLESYNYLLTCSKQDKLIPCVQK